MEKCRACEKTGTAKCARCESESYCSKACQKQHWPEHKAACFTKEEREMQRKVAKETSVYCCSVCQVRRPNRSLLKTCALCRRVSYCSTECQKADWKEHKKICVARHETEKNGFVPHKKKVLNVHQKKLQQLLVEAA